MLRLAFRTTSLLALTFVVSQSSTLVAQTPGKVVGVIGGEMPDSSQMAALMAVNMRSPAQFVLAHNGELALTPEQVGALANVDSALKDSAKVRLARMRDAMRARPPLGPAALQSMKSMMEWSGPIDETAIRAQACEQSASQAEVIINLARDRQRVGGLLTDAQRGQLNGLQAADIMKAMKRP